MDERLVYEVLEVVGEIPSGKVATYENGLRSIGRPKNKISWKDFKSGRNLWHYPCHRIVNANWKTGSGWLEQKLY